MIILTLVSGSVHGEPFSVQDAVNEDLGSPSWADDLKGKAKKIMKKNFTDFSSRKKASLISTGI